MTQPGAYVIPKLSHVCAQKLNFVSFPILKNQRFCKNGKKIQQDNANH